MTVRLIALTLVLVLLLTACSSKTTLTFTNATDCGTATITLTHQASGNVQDFSVQQGKTIKIDLEPNTEYLYEVTYPRGADYLQCDAKRVVTMLNKGQTVNVRLTSVLDEPLQQATATAEAAATAQN